MATINGRNVPFDDLKVGSKWTGSYTHSERGNATQCLGFCYLVYNKIWDSDTYGSTVPKMTLAGTSNDFANIKVGAWVRCGKLWHALVIIDKTSKGVTVYDCNFVGTDTIGSKFYNWSDFKGKFTNFEYGYTPQYVAT